MALASGSDLIRLWRVLRAELAMGAMKFSGEGRERDGEGGEEELREGREREGLVWSDGASDRIGAWVLVKSLFL